MKILIIRFSSIGDIILTTPVIRCLKKQLGAEVHFLTKKRFGMVVAANPYLNKVHAFDKKLEEVIPALKEESFDWIIDLHKNLRSFRVKRSLGIKSKSFDKINWEKWLIVNFKINRLPNLHIVDRNLKTVEHLGVLNDGEGLDYFIPPKDEINLADIIGTSFDTRSVIAFVIGAAHATKRLPEHKVIEICQRIKEPIIILGGPDEQDKGAHIARASGVHVFNACGKLNLNQSASVVKQAGRVISHDTGLMHMAAAFNKKIVSIWGNTVPEFGMYPYFGSGAGKNTSIQVEGLSCRPCSKIGFKKCPKGHFKCMNDIDGNAVANALTD